MAFINRIIVYLLAGALLLSGCTSWRMVETPSPTGEYEHVRLVMRDESKLEVKQVHIQGDTLVGLGKRTVLEWRKEASYYDVPTEIPLADIHWIETKQTDVGRTVGLSLALGAVAFVGAFIIAFAVSDGGGSLLGSGQERGEPLQ